MIVGLASAHACGQPGGRVRQQPGPRGHHKVCGGSSDEKRSRLRPRGLLSPPRFRKPFDVKPSLAQRTRRGSAPPSLPDGSIRDRAAVSPAKARLLLPDKRSDARRRPHAHRAGNPDRPAPHQARRPARSPRRRCGRVLCGHPDYETNRPREARSAREGDIACCGRMLVSQGLQQRPVRCANADTMNQTDERAEL